MMVPISNKNGERDEDRNCPMHVLRGLTTLAGRQSILLKDVAPISLSARMER